VRKLSRYSKFLGLVAAGAMAGCATSETSKVTSGFGGAPSGSGFVKSSAAPAGAAAAANGEASTGPMSRISTAISGSASSVKAMFVSSPPPTKVPTLPSVADNPNPPKATPDFHVAMAKQMESAGDLAGAEEQYHKALAIDDENLIALINLAHLCDRQKRMAEAEALYVKATKLHPGEATAFNDLGLCYARQHKLVQSQTALAEAVKLDGNRKLYRNNLATVLVELNRPQQAIEHLQAVHEPSVAHYNLGYLLANKGEDQLAEHYFRQALQIDPTMTAAQTWLDSLSGQPTMLSARASDSASADNSPSSAAPESLSELSSAGPDLHPGIQKLPPVDSAGPAPSRY
jgi:Flp pilus assembly protein TadD